jgi:hypothetical protein
MDANAAFDAVQKIAKSSKNLADRESMKARGRAVTDQFLSAMSTGPQASAKPEIRALH